MSSSDTSDKARKRAYSSASRPCRKLGHLQRLGLLARLSLYGIVSMQTHAGGLLAPPTSPLPQLKSRQKCFLNPEAGYTVCAPLQHCRASRVLRRVDV